MSSELPEELEGIEEELELDADDQFGDDPSEPDTDETDRDRSEPEEHYEFVICAIGDDRVAVHVDAVKQVVDLTDVIRVPRTSGAIDGITDLRGEITAVIDPRILFDVGPIGDETGEQDVVVFQLGREEGNSGLRIDRVADITSVPVSKLVLEATDLGEDDETALQLLDSQLYAGLIDESDDGDEKVYIPIVDVEALIDSSKEQVTNAAAAGSTTD